MSIRGLDLRSMSRSASLLILLGTSVFGVGLALGFSWCVAGLAVFLPLFLVDVYARFVQRRQAIPRNFGVFGIMRYILESIGPELRQYWIASDTEERPFSRRERAEIYRYAKDERIKSSAFGTQQKSLEEGTIRHSFFPTAADSVEGFSLTFGEERSCAQVYTINRPFMVSAMSFGSLGEHAVRAMCRGARKAGIPVCTGEGGYPKHHLAEGADLIFQMGTAKFGVRNEDSSLNDDKLRELSSHEQVKMIEIKLSQGAKPGKGGLLPGEKVSREISELRGVPVGKDVYSPSRHIECDNPANTVAFIQRVQQVSGLPVGIKFCLGREVELSGLVAEMKRSNVFPDYIALDGSEGGTGAAPAAFLDHVGIPLHDAMPLVIGVLEEQGVRDRLKLVAAGKLINPARQLRALACGADAIYTARGFMLALGCIQALRCNAGDCPVGITTHDRSLQRGLDIEEKSERVLNYARNAHHILEELLAATGHTSTKELNPADLYLPEQLGRI